MIYISMNMFLECPERYIDAAKNGKNVYICLDGGIELKLEKHMK